MEKLILYAIASYKPEQWPRLLKIAADSERLPLTYDQWKSHVDQKVKQLEKEMHQHACFYFRDPAFVANVPAEKKSDFTSESPELAAKLQRLKNDIRHACKEQIW